MNEAPTPEQNRQGMHLVVDVIEFIFDNGPDIEWPRWKSTGDLTIPELADKCLRTVKAHVKHNIDTTDWSSSTIGAPPANLMEVASEVNEQFRKLLRDHGPADSRAGNPWHQVRWR